MKTMYAVQNGTTGQINCAFNEPEDAQAYIDRNVDSGAWDDNWDTAPIQCYDDVKDWDDRHARKQ